MPKDFWNLPVNPVWRVPGFMKGGNADNEHSNPVLLPLVPEFTNIWISHLQFLHFQKIFVRSRRDWEKKCWIGIRQSALMKCTDSSVDLPISSASVCQSACFGALCITADHTLSNRFLVGWGFVLWIYLVFHSIHPSCWRSGKGVLNCVKAHERIRETFL